MEIGGHKESDMTARLNTHTLNNQVEKKTYPMDACQFLSPNTQGLSQ